MDVQSSGNKRFRIRRLIAGVLLLAGISLLGVSASAGADASGCDGNPLQVFSQPPAGFNPATASNAQLVAYGFPPRPPGDSTSPAVEAWLTAVTSAKTYVAPDPVCASVVHTSTGKGHLVGGIVFTGRAPRGSARRYQAGWVRVTRSGHTVARKYVDRNEKYRFMLSPGTYKLVARTKNGTCTSHARVRAGHTTDSNTYCLFH
jgi:hypothetical protein